MIYDILVIVIFLFAVVIGFNRGAAKSLVSLIGYAAAFLIAAFLGEFLSGLIYDSYIRTSIIESVTSSLSTDAVNVENIALPPFVAFVFELTGFDLTSAFMLSADALSSSIAVGFESAIRPVVVSVLSFFLTTVIFLILFFVFKLILNKLLLSVFRLPGLRGLNKILGALLGVFNSVLIISFLAFLLKMIMPYLNNTPYILSESTIYNSYIFYHFYSGNIFYNISNFL